MREVDEPTRDKAAKAADGLSFAHLREVQRLSGLLAMENGRRDRAIDDVTKAVDLVRQGHEHAARGFPKPPELPFGLQHKRR
jgi:hypothetical protein